MLKKTITYTDLDGKEVNETAYFNLSKRELLKLDEEYADQGGLETVVQKLSEEEDKHKILAIYEKFIFASYGVRPEGKNAIVKNAELVEEFIGSGAYDALFDELFYGTNNELQTFLLGIFPKEATDAMSSSAAKTA